MSWWSYCGEDNHTFFSYSCRVELSKIVTHLHMCVAEIKICWFVVQVEMQAIFNGWNVEYSVKNTPISQASV